MKKIGIIVFVLLMGVSLGLSPVFAADTAKNAGDNGIVEVKKDADYWKAKYMALKADVEKKAGETWQKTKVKAGELTESAKTKTAETWDKTKVKAGETWQKTKISIGELKQRTVEAAGRTKEKAVKTTHEAVKTIKERMVKKQPETKPAQ